MDSKPSSRHSPASGGSKGLRLVSSNSGLVGLARQESAWSLANTASVPAHVEYASLDDTATVRDIMADPTREEMDAKLALVEARLENRLVGIEGKIDRLLDQIANQSQAIQDTKAMAGKAQDAAISTKWNTIFVAFAVFGSVLAVVGFAWQALEVVKAFFPAP